MVAKFQVPSERTWVVRRHRLFDALSRGADGPLTLLRAPAGCGKTALASSWVAAGAAPGPVTWISLDDEDARPGVFWSYVVAGLAGSGVPTAEVGLPPDADTAEQALLVRLAAGLAECARPVVLLLDNAQVLTAGAVPDGIDFLIRHAAPRLRVVVVTRAEPPLPLYRYRLEGWVTEVGFDELAFTRGETQALLAAHHVDLPDGAVTALMERTRGWAAAIRLAAVSAAMPVAYDDGGSDIAAYFRAEVLDAQPPAVREFLLCTSVVDRLWPELAVELTGRQDAVRTLANLARENTFVAPSPEDRRSYEFHPLVRDLLRARLHDECPGTVGLLHRRAAAWFAAQGRLSDATRHAIAAGDWSYAVRLVIEDLAVDRLLVGPEGVDFAETFAGLPPEVTGPEAAVIRSTVALARLDTDACAEHLIRARESVPASRICAVEVAIAVVDLLCACRRGDVEVTPVARAVLDDAAASGLEVPAALRALVLASTGCALVRAGDFDAAVATLTDGLRAADRPECGYLQVACLGDLALIEALGGRLRRAAELGLRARAAAERCRLSMVDRPPAAEVALAWEHVEEYDLVSARIHARNAATAKGIRDDPVAAGVLALVRARLRRAQGDVAGAVAVIDREPAAGTAAAPPWLLRLMAASAAGLRTGGAARDGVGAAAPHTDLTATPQGEMVMAAAELAGGQPTQAGATAAEVLRHPDVPLDVQVDAWLLTASCELAEGSPERARRALDRALGLAAAERLRRPVVEASSGLRRFLRQEHDLTERHAWLGAAVVGPPEARVVGGASPITEPLTDKELEVLRHMAALLSTDEIARTMFVSVNTVKTHVRGVLRKLAVPRRNEAIRRARELGLV